MDGTRSDYVKGNMPERQILYFFSYIWTKPRLQIYIMCMCMCDETIKRSTRGEEGSLREGRKRRWWTVDNKKTEETIGGEEESVLLQLPKYYT